MEFIKNLLIKLSLTIIVLSVLSITFIDHTTRDLFGYKITSVADNSMNSLGFNKNDLIVIKNVDPFVLGKNDIITYRSTNQNNYFEIVTSQIGERINDTDEYPGFITHNLLNNENDEKIVKYEYILGKYVFTLKGAGIYFRFLKSPIGYICFIFIPFFILLFTFIVDRIKASEKKRQEDKIKATSKKRMTRVELHSNKNIMLTKIQKNKTNS